jgi:cold shock CspA family protein
MMTVPGNGADAVPETERLSGIVVVRQEGFGFIKCLNSAANDSSFSRLYFHSNDCVSPGLVVGQRVTFELHRENRTGKLMAKQVTQLGNASDDGNNQNHTSSARERINNLKGDSLATSNVEIAIPGQYTGVVQAVPKAGADVRVDDGMLSFIDLEGQQQQAMFGSWRVQPVINADGSMKDVAVELGLPVQFTLSQNPMTKVLKANAIRVDHDVVEAMKRLGLGGGRTRSMPVPEANQQVSNRQQGVSPMKNTQYPESAETQVGKVVLLKKEFGFVKRLFESGDLFFHFSELDASSDPTIARGSVKIGDELEFTVRTDDNGRACACNIKRAPPGSAQFEVIGDEIFHGVVVEKPVLGKSYEKTPGVIDYVPKPLINVSVYDKKEWSTMPKMKMLFYPNESEGIQTLRPGSHVVFRILTDVNAMKSAKLACKDGMLVDLICRRAVQIQAIRGEGTIVELQKHFGFITWSGSLLEGLAAPRVQTAKGNKHRLFFNRNEIDKACGGVVRIGDVVYFCLQSTKSLDDMAACRLKVKDLGMEARQNDTNEDGSNEVKVPGATRRQPLRLKKPSTAVPRIPDGTRGFLLTRGEELRNNSSVDEKDIVSMCCGYHLSKVLHGEMRRSLSVEAIPFEMRL